MKVDEPNPSLPMYVGTTPPKLPAEEDPQPTGPLSFGELLRRYVWREEP